MARNRFQRACIEFAEHLTHLLNATVTDGASVRASGLSRTGARIGTGPLGYGGKPSPIRLRTVRDVNLWLGVDAQLFEGEGGYLTVEKSTWALRCGEDAEETVLHYDYERDKDGYPEAHLQVSGRSSPLEHLLQAVGRRKSRLDHLHLPVGGRRFRPALEDLIEFLIDERLVDAKPHSKRALERSRTTYHDIQLLAAIRRHPTKASEGVRGLPRALEPTA